MIRHTFINLYTDKIIKTFINGLKIKDLLYFDPHMNFIDHMNLCYYINNESMLVET